MEDKVYVALGKEFEEGKSTLIWALNNTDRSKKVVILHVHRPAQLIPIMGAKFGDRKYHGASELKEGQLGEYRLLESAMMHEALDEYIRLCKQAKVRAEKLVIEMDDVSKGIVELIALHGIHKLVMGAAADEHYSKFLFYETPAVRCTTAINVRQQADPICKIWFVCKGNLIYTSARSEAGPSQYSIPQSPTTSISSSNQSEHLRSAMSVSYESLSVGNMSHSSLEEIDRTSASRSSTEGSVDLWEATPRNPQASNADGTDLHCVIRGEESEVSLVNVQSVNEFEEVLARQRKEIEEVLARQRNETEELKNESDNVIQELCKALEHESALQQQITDSNCISNELNEKLSQAQHLRDNAVRELEELRQRQEDASTSSERVVNFLEFSYSEIQQATHKKLLEAQSEAENLKQEAYEEAHRRQKAERDTIEATRKAKASENLYTRELRQRKEIEEVLARQRIETEELKKDNVIEKLQKALEQESALQQQQITYSNCISNELDEKLTEALHLLNSLKQEYHELEGERDNAVREVEELRQRQEDASTSSERVVNFSEFSYSEIQQATHNFSDSMKIGKGGYGSVYKGFLRNTIVAIKVLNQENMQGQDEFHQEVEVLTKVRHPHLVTLIGVCSEAWALVYEYCINGSLQDRLACKDNTAPLTWQVRTRIAAEICLALISLHSHKPLGVVHGDVKTANILMDANMVSKLGDFGICRLLAESTNTNTAYCNTQPKGSFGYIDPEFLLSGKLTTLSDVYSFGIILLRLLTGKAIFGLAKEVQRALSENRLESVLDPTAGDWPFVQARQLAHLALRCCEIKREKRPNLSLDAWKVLEPMTKAASLEGSSSMPLGSGVEDNSNIPSYFVCPIFQEIMSDPHIAADGFTYEAEALKGWLDGGDDTSPMTNIRLPNKKLIPNRALCSAIQEWQQRHT